MSATAGSLREFWREIPMHQNQILEEAPKKPRESARILTPEEAVAAREALLSAQRLVGTRLHQIMDEMMQSVSWPADARQLLHEFQELRQKMEAVRAAGSIIALR